MIPEPQQTDIQWAYRLWTSMTLGGNWTLPGVGVYVRTGPAELTLTTIYSAKPHTDAFGNSIFDKHDWIVGLGEIMGFTILENVEVAFDETDEIMNIPKEKVGHVAICEARCGAIFKVNPLSAGVAYVKIDSERTCPVCGEQGAVEPALEGVHCVVDDSSVILKKGIREEE